MDHDLELLDLRQEQMSEALHLYCAGDEAGAKQAAEALIRTRLAALAAHRSFDRRKEATTADEIIAGQVRLLNYPPQPLGSPVDWDYWLKEDGTWNEHLGNMYLFNSLARMYAHTGDERFARRWCSLADDFIAHVAYERSRADRWQTESRPMFRMGKQTCDNGENGHWMSLAVAGRAMHWLECCGRLSSSPHLTSTLLWRILRSLYNDHYHILVNNSRKNTPNQYAETSLSLIALGVAVPWLWNASPAYLIGCWRFRDAIESQSFPDGTDLEQSPNYNAGEVHKIEHLLDIISETAEEEKDFFRDAARRRLRYLLQLCDPQLCIPDIAKHHACGDFLEYFRKYGRLFGVSDALWLVTDGVEGAEPAYTSAALRWGGYYVLRSGFTGTPDFLFFKSSRMGAGHMHEDELGIVLNSGGRRLLVDSGNFSYGGRTQIDLEMNVYSLSTRSHSSVLVDGKGQNRMGLLKSLRTDPSHVPPVNARGAEPLPFRALTAEKFEYLEGCYADGYGEDRSLRVRHIRQILWLKERGWLVFDTLRPADDAEHCYQQLWQLAPEFADRVRLDMQRNHVTAENDGTSFYLASAAALPVSVACVCGTENPACGWYSVDYGQRVPKPDIAFRMTGRGVVRMATFLHTAAHPALVRMHHEIAGGDNRYCLSFDDGAVGVLSTSETNDENPCTSEIDFSIPGMRFSWQSRGGDWCVEIPASCSATAAVLHTEVDSCVEVKPIFRLGED